MAKQNGNFGTMYFITNSQAMTRETKRDYFELLANAQAIEICELTAKSHVFFVPVTKDETSIIKFLAELGSTIMKNKMATNEENAEFIKTKVVSFLVEQFNELKTDAEHVAKTAMRPGAIRNRIKQFYALRAIAEFYSELLDLPTKKFNSLIENSVANMRQELKTFEYSNK